MNKNTNGWLSFIPFLSGLWLAVSPFLLAYANSNIPNAQSATANNVVAGVLIALLAFISLYGSRVMVGFLSWILSLLGIYQILAPFIIGYTNIDQAVMNDVIIGLTILVFSASRALGVNLQKGTDLGRTYTSETRPRQSETKKGNKSKDLKKV